MLLDAFSPSIQRQPVYFFTEARRDAASLHADDDDMTRALQGRCRRHFYTRAADGGLTYYDFDMRAFPLRSWP